VSAAGGGRRHVIEIKPRIGRDQPSSGNPAGFPVRSGSMNPTTATPGAGPIVYPESDGLPMSDSTKQLRWIVTLYGNLAALFRERADVFVAGNLLWYPVEGQPESRNAPDVLVVFGRPKADRGSYKQWEEGGVPPTVVFEVVSPSNSVSEMNEKLAFYDEYGVEEYYQYDPDVNRMTAFVRAGEVFRRVRQVNGFRSPRLEVIFDLSGPELIVLRSDGRPFLSFEELEAARASAEHRAARLAELGRKARRGRASAEELRELERLEDQSAPPPG
jgi:Uma2 family endonuclease